VNENVRDSGQSGRQFRFDTLASELVSGVEVIKSPLPSLEEGAIGGIVNIRTFRPLDFKKPTVAVSATASYKDLADVTDPQYSGLVSWNNADRTLGALLSLNYNHRTLRQDRITGVGWAQSAGVDTNQDGVADSGALNVPTAVRPTLEFEQRDRYGLTGALQWKPSEQTEVTLDLLYSQLRDQYDELTYSADFNLTAKSIVAGTAVIRDGALVGATTGGTSTQIGREVSDLEHTNFLIGLNAVHHMGPWTLSADISSGRAFSDTRNPITRTRILGATGSLTWSLPDVEGGVPSLKFLTANLNDPKVVPGRRIEWRVNHATDLDSAAQFDAVRSLDFGPFTQVSFGAKYHERSRDYKRRDVNLTRLLSGANYTASYFDQSFFEAFPVSNFLGDVSGSLPTSWDVPNPGAFWNATNASAIIDNSTLTARALGDYRNSYYVSEKIAAAYVSTQIQTSLFGGELRGEGGLRYAKTDQVSAGYATTATAAIPVSYQKTYNDLLPSLSLLWKPMDKIQVHASAAKVMTRPSLADLSPRLTLNSSGTVFTAVGGNPQLDPFKANQYDLTAEWYFAPGSALIAGAFVKDITTFVYNQNTTIQVDGQAYTLTAPVNGGDARVNGYELAYQHIFKNLPAPFDGLGMLANYTYTDSEATYTPTLKDKMQSVAKNSYNLTVFYEKDAVAARLSYSWVDDVLTNVGTGGFAAINDKAFGTLDGSLSYKVSDVVTLVAEGQNLTNQAQWQFVGQNLFGGYTNYGRTFSLSIRAKY
jgi:TonB-dependent receptor